MAFGLEIADDAEHHAIGVHGGRVPGQQVLARDRIDGGVLGLGGVGLSSP